MADGFHGGDDPELESLRAEFGKRWEITRARYADGWMFRARPFPPKWDGEWVVKADAEELRQQLRMIEGNPGA